MGHPKGQLMTVLESTMTAAARWGQRKVWSDRPMARQRLPVSNVGQQVELAEAEPVWLEVKPPWQKLMAALEKRKAEAAESWRCFGLKQQRARRCLVARQNRPAGEVTWQR